MNSGLRRNALVLFALSALLLATPLLATIGAAEWQVVTPGGNRIVHLDPLKAKHGTCLIGGRGDDGRSLGEAEVYVAQIHWWQYYPKKYVTGETDNGFFLFDEVSRSVDWYTSIEAMRTHAQQRSGGGPASEPLTSAMKPVG